jgi:tetratricopeptide (TPR) repeat protein
VRRAWVLALLVAQAGLASEPDEISLPELKGEAKARIQNLDQALNDWDLEGATQELAELAKVVPVDAAPLAYYQGRVAFEAGRYDEAVERFTTAGISDKTDSWLRLARQTREVVGKHQRVESAHFIFDFPAGRDAVLATWALEALEHVRTALAEDLRYAPPGKVRVELVGSAAELSKVSTLSKEAIKTTGTIAICKFNKLMVTSPRAVLKGYDWLDTLAHEYVHLVVSRKSRNTVPIWMHEGLAKYLESRWHGPAGGAMTPSTLALLGSRVRKNTLVPFEKMHPSMALLPTAEDAATAFAEVFFAIELIHREHGADSLARLLETMAKGGSDRAAVEAVTRKKWPEFERAWMAHLRRQPFPKELIPRSSNEKKELAEHQGGKKKSAREVSFGDFAEVSEVEARRAAHLGELLRERQRMPAASEAYARAWKQVGDRYESVSNKYALTLLELKRFDEAARVLEGSLVVHPGSASTNVHLGRIRLRAKAWVKAKAAYLDALAVNPFDPEVHVALYATAQATQDAALQARTLEAVKVLLKLDDQAVTRLARQFANIEDLANVDVGGTQPASTPPDAG